MKRAICTLPLLLVLTATSVASAKPGYNGYSGLTSGKTCGDCHSGGAKPVVSLKAGPASLVEGQTGQYTVTVAGSLARTEVDVAAADNNGVKLTLASDSVTTKITGGEAIPISNFNAGASADYTFSLTAPKGATSITLYALGMASNGSGTGGDGEDAKTFKVAVTTSGTPTDAGVGDAGVVSDGGTNGDAAASGDAASGDAGTTAGDASSGSDASTQDSGASAEGTTDPNEEDPLGASSDTGCSASSHRGLSGTSGLLVAIALIFTMRGRHTRAKRSS